MLEYDSGAPTTWQISINEYMEIALLRFFVDARVGAVVFSCFVSRMGCNCQGVLVPQPFEVRRRVDDIGLFDGIRGSGFDPGASLIAYSRSSKVDCTLVGPPRRPYLYHFFVMVNF